MKYFPSLSLMTRALRIGVDDFNRHKMTLVSTKVLRKLIEAALEGVEFDEKWYLKQYGDIADAHRKGQIVNLREHFITSGYFEGRRPSGRHFDARWYVSTNKDVADALRQGRLDSPLAHYERVGESEGRPPREDGKDEVSEWMKALFTNP